MPGKSPVFPGFTALSDQAFFREGVEINEKPKHHVNDPTLVLLYGWGDGLPKHVAKYADGFRELFPYAKQVVVLSPISRAMFSDLRQRTQYMQPVLKAILNTARACDERVLVHTMSNTGAVNYAATLNAYQETYGKALPHQLLIMDSTPGGTDLNRMNVSRWSRAMALGTAGWFPWPFILTQSIWAVFLCLNSAYSWLVGRESAGAWSVRAVLDTKYEVKEAHKLYMYSKEDEIIHWEDIEKHVAESRALGWQADTETFGGTGHVGHMRKFPNQYWAAIQKAWKRTALE